MYQDERNSSVLPPTYSKFLGFAESCVRNRACRFGGVLAKSKPALDLIIADIPEGLPVPSISNPPSTLPVWNEVKHVEYLMHWQT